jgi:hypothetical protein
MTRALSAAPIALCAFIATLALAALALRIGFVSDYAVTLWAGAITAGDGAVPIGRIVASYPTVPFLAATLLELVMPPGAPTPALLAGGLVALLAGTWFLEIRATGLPIAVVCVATLLLALHPALLRAVLAGPSEMFLALFLYLFGAALYDLRARTAAPEVMAAGLSLLGLAFSHPIGAAIAFAAPPFFVFAVRPTLIANSALNVVVALIFPTVFSALAFAYVSWVFPGSGWSFFGVPTEGFSSWAADAPRFFGASIPGLLPLDTALAVAFALLLGAPLVPAALALAYRRRPLVAPALVLAAAVVMASAIAVATGLFGDPVATCAIAPILAAIVLIRVPSVHRRPTLVSELLVAGWLGGVVGLTFVDPRITAQVSAAIDGRTSDQDRIDSLTLGGATSGHTGVLVDIENAPGVVIGRGQARGLLGPSDETFAISLLFARIEAPFVAVPDPQRGAGAQDRLNKTFPKLYSDGPPGYRLIYQNHTWRLFGREEQKGR